MRAGGPGLTEEMAQEGHITTISEEWRTQHVSASLTCVSETHEAALGPDLCTVASDSGRYVDGGCWVDESFTGKDVPIAEQ